MHFGRRLRVQNGQASHNMLVVMTGIFNFIIGFEWVFKLALLNWEWAGHVSSVKNRTSDREHGCGPALFSQTSILWHNS